MSLATTLACPVCRTRTDDRIDVRTLEPAGPDQLACSCGRTYPVVRGIPVVAAHLPDLASLLADASPDAAAQRTADDPRYAQLLEHLSIYLDAHWGDRAEPPPDGPAPIPAVAPFLDRLAALPRVGAAVELGCSTGRVLATLAARADHVVGLELHVGALAHARTLLAGGTVTYARKLLAHYFGAATARGLPAPNVSFVCADALDPPLIPRAFDRVVALNLVDSVRAPGQLLSVLDGLCAPGGEVIVASPYAWQPDITPDPAPLDGPDPAGKLRALLTSGDGLEAPYDLLDDTDLRWALRRDARSAVTYEVHYVRARKRGGT